MRIRRSDRKEQFWIDETLPFFNVLRVAHSAAGFTHSDDARERMSEIAKARWVSLSEDEKAERAKKHSERMTGKTASDETRLKMSEAHKGKIFTEAQLKVLHSPPSPNASRAAVIAKSKSFVVTNPEGEEQSITNLTGFCRENGLAQSHMDSVSKGKRNHHKGWKCRPACLVSEPL